MKTILTAEMASASLALVSFVSSLVLFSKNRRLSRTCANFEFRLDEEMNALSTDVDTVSQKSGEYGRKIAWLETRVRPARAESTPVAETVTAINAKPTITERRHRVL